MLVREANVLSQATLVEPNNDKNQQLVLGHHTALGSIEKIIFTIYIEWRWANLRFLMAKSYVCKYVPIVTVTYGGETGGWVKASDRC